MEKLYILLTRRSPDHASHVAVMWPVTGASVSEATQILYVSLEGSNQLLATTGS